MSHKNAQSASAAAAAPSASPTARDNFHRLMRGEEGAWLPLDITATQPIVDRVEEHLETRDLVAAFDLDGCRIPLPRPNAISEWTEAISRIGFDLPAGADVADDGVAHLRPIDGSTGGAYHFQQMLHPLEGVATLDEVQAMPWADYEAWTRSVEPQIVESIRAIHATGRFSIAPLECSVFEFAWYTRGMEQLFMDLIEGNGIADFLLDHNMRRTAAYARMCARCGADIIDLGDDIGTQKGMMMAPDFWREHLKPRLKHIIDVVRAERSREDGCYIFYHSDGDIRAVLDDLIEMGVDILNPLQPECMPLAEVIPQYQDRVAFWGMIGTQTTMPFGTPADVRAAVAELKDFASRGARLVVAPTHVLEPEVPWENIAALAEAVREK